MNMDYGFTRHAPTRRSPRPSARCGDALTAQGFGVLTEIDVQATLRAKLGEQMEDYLILGACNPPLAHRALAQDRQIGLLLPCNVVVRTQDGQTVMEALDPMTMVQVTGEDVAPARSPPRPRPGCAPRWRPSLASVRRGSSRCGQLSRAGRPRCPAGSARGPGRRPALRRP